MSRATDAPTRVLILGGTAEARELADLATRHTGIEVVSSLAGRTADPVLPQGRTRVGGFGGAAGLAGWIAEHAVDAVIDATHPFASSISGNAAAAAAEVHVPLLALRRAPWVPQDGDRWHQVVSLQEAAHVVPALGERALLAIGRQGVHHFAADEHTWYLVRCIDPPEGALVGSSIQLARFGTFEVAQRIYDLIPTLRGLRTLPLRVGRHNLNASEVASFLAAREDVEWLSYPGLASGPHAHPQAACASRQNRCTGASLFRAVAPEASKSRTFAVPVTRLYDAIASAHGVMDLDALATARAVRQPVTTTSEAHEAFDGITYEKGAAVLATIERVTDRTKGRVKRVKTLLARQRMSADAALDLATSYAEWKQIPVVYTDSWPPLVR